MENIKYNVQNSVGRLQFKIDLVSTNELDYNLQSLVYNKTEKTLLHKLYWNIYSKIDNETSLGFLKK